MDHRQKRDDAGTWTIADEHKLALWRKMCHRQKNTYSKYLVYLIVDSKKNR